MKAHDDLPRTLVISHNCFSESGSNGRTLAGFFEGYPREKLAQLYIVNEEPDLNICDKYYKLTDVAILKSILSFTNAGEIVKKRTILHNEVISVSPNKMSSHLQKYTFSLLFRECMWNAPCWKKKQMYAWIDDFKPELIVFQAGNLGYLCKLVRKIANLYKIPLVVYNSEGYYFKKYDYVKETLSHSYIFELYMRRFRKEFSKMMQTCSYAIYITPELKKEYDAEFACDSICLMTATNNIFREARKKKRITHEDNLRISYLGNLDLGRHSSLIEVANTLSQIDKKIKLNVYGKTKDTKILDELCKCSAINYCGFVSYDEVLNIINSSDINIHVEGFEPFYLEDSKYAFSTKIADLLASGNCVFIYADEGLTFTKYIKNTKSGCVVTQKKELLPTLEKIILYEDAREQYEKNAVELAMKNHDIHKNKQKFQQILREVVRQNENSSS